MNGAILVEKLIRYAMLRLHLSEYDVEYMRNFLLSELKLTAPYDGEEDFSEIDKLAVPDLLIQELSEYAIENGLTDEFGAERFCANIFGSLSPLPSKLNDVFSDIKKKEGAQRACDYLYELCVYNGYIQKTAIAKNLKWKFEDERNVLEITVNLSKPEKNNKDIAKLLTAPQSKKYPMCALCKENEGFEGTATHPPRRNLRTIKFTLGGEKWFMQYSPYAYYDEHCIVINESHTPMKVDAQTPVKLLDFVDAMPNYFIGSNASLPIIGGSILNHEHFQGGRHKMPMHRAGYRKLFQSKKYPSLKIGILDWYNSALQCEGNDRKEIELFMADVINHWKDFSCEKCDIIAETNGVRHNSLSPICRKEGDKYIVSAILRNNRTNEQYPDGIFHVHPEFLNIKSEGIGLIEAMGLFILPGRLKRQLDKIEDVLCGKEKYDRNEFNKETSDLYVHRLMIENLISQGQAEDKETARNRVREYVNRVCANILDNTAVFKRDKNGEDGFNEFMRGLELIEL